jgi:hypothetical protein
MTSFDKPVSHHDHTPVKTHDQLGEALDQLTDHQQQLDGDGVMVGVSREALDIVLDHVAKRGVTVDVKLDASEARAALGEVADLAKDVTRFLVHPDCKVVHGADEQEFTVASLHTVDGVLHCDCEPVGGGEAVMLPFRELWPAGPASDSTREMVKIVARSITEDMVAQLIEQGALKKPDPADLPAYASPPLSREPHPDWQSGGQGGRHAPMDRPEITVEHDLIPGMEQIVGGEQSETVHHLGVHPEYLMEPNSTKADPAVKE